MKRVRAFIDSENMSILGRFMLNFAIAYSLTVGAAYVIIQKEWVGYAKKSILLSEENTDDPYETCRILMCEYVKAGDSTVYRHSNGNFSDTVEKINSLNRFIKEAMTVNVMSDKTGVVYGMNALRLFKFYVNITVILYIFLVMQSLVFLIKYIVSSNIKSLKDGASDTAKLHNKNMAILAEQLHHEMNTPLSVVKELCDKTFETATEFVRSTQVARCPGTGKACVGCVVPDALTEILEKKRIIDNNMKQAFVVLERMAEVKQVRYSNGNKSLYDIAKATIDIMSVYNRANFTSYIDDRLKDYTIDHRSGLKNHELMNILVNHAKNSLEANASEIRIVLNNIVEPSPTRSDKTLEYIIEATGRILPRVIHDKLSSYLYSMVAVNVRKGISIAKIAMIDNGNGIPEYFRNDIFKLHSSTKKKDGMVRGAGLYLNREILRSSYGDLYLYDTSKKGTVFILDIPIEHKVV